MSDNLNIKLLKQHAAILETALQTVNNVSKSITEEAAALDAELAPIQDATDALVACERAQERARFAEAKLNKAVADLHFVMAGGDACKVCTVKCAFGEGNCKPVWRGEAGADCDFERTVPALLPQPGDRDGQKTPP